MNRTPSTAPTVQLPAARPDHPEAPPHPGVGAPVPGSVARPEFRWYPRLTRVTDRSVVGGVAAGVAFHLGVRVTTVRIAFVIAAMLGGAGVLAYAALWVLTPSGPPPVGAPAPDPAERRRGMVLVAIGIVSSFAAVMATTASGLAVLTPILVVAVGAMLVWQQYDRGGRSGPRSSFDWARVTAGATLVVVGLAVVVLGQVDLAAVRSSLLAVVATLVGVGLLTVPLWLRMWRTIEDERSARIREAERSDIASHLHDSVLQTLALIQKRSDDPHQVSRLARRQERELRQWLFGSADRMSSGASTVAGVVETVCADVEDAYGLRVDQVVVGGDAPVGEHEDAALGAMREALVNVGKHAGVENADVYVEVTDEALSAFVRDRGRGFDPDAVDPDRHGLAQSIRHRVESRGGSVTVRSTLGRGTEIGVEMPRGEEER